MDKYYSAPFTQDEADDQNLQNTMLNVDKCNKQFGKILLGPKFAKCNCQFRQI